MDVVAVVVVIVVGGGIVVREPLFVDDVERKEPHLSTICKACPPVQQQPLTKSTTCMA